MRGIFKGIWAAVIVLGNFVRDGMQVLRACVSSRSSLAAENLFLRKQLSFYQEHQIRPTAHQLRSCGFGLLVQILRVAVRPPDREASDLDWLAPQGVQPSLEMEIPIGPPAPTKGPSSARR